MIYVIKHMYIQVCGTDGVTYDNVCVLRAQSANARVDYGGECEEDSGESPEQICVRVSQAKRCIYNSSNCRHLVRPEEGCCALCGKQLLSLSLSLPSPSALFPFLPPFIHSFVYTIFPSQGGFSTLPWTELVFVTMSTSIQQQEH